MFSEIAGNHIYNIWTKRQFTGAEIAGIKIHAAVDLRLANNRIHNVGRGLWMDWMAQGTRITGNLCYDNTLEDLFVEVNHGPFLVDNNLFLSKVSLQDWSQGGAYAYNLMAGKIDCRPELTRATPFHEPHSTALAGSTNIAGGDDRFYNNLFVGEAPGGKEAARDPKEARKQGYGLWVYDTRERPTQAAGNVYFREAKPYTGEKSPTLLPEVDPALALVEEGEQVFLRIDVSPEWRKAETVPVTGEFLGKTAVARLPYENRDGSPVTVVEDYLGHRREATRPWPGPFEALGDGRVRLKVW